MDTFSFITQLEGKLKAAVSLLPYEEDQSQWLLTVNLFYEDGPAGKTTFTLHGYNELEAQEIARNIKSNPYLMREIDEYLWGESD